MTTVEIARPPLTEAEPVVDILHGLAIEDPYRWLEDHDSPRTKEWIAEQTAYTRQLLDALPGQDRIRRRVEELMAVDTYDSPRLVCGRTFFLKRRAHEQQPSIYMTRFAGANEERLVDPANCGGGPIVSLSILSVSSDASLLAYGIGRDGSSVQEIEILDVESRLVLPDKLPRGHVGGFAFANDSRSFYYAHEPAGSPQIGCRAVHRHRIGTPLSEDQEIFSAGAGQHRLTFGLSPDRRWASYEIKRFSKDVTHELHVQDLSAGSAPVEVLKASTSRIMFAWSSSGLIGLLTQGAPNGALVRIGTPFDGPEGMRTIVPERPWQLRQFVIAGDRIIAVYVVNACCATEVFDLDGRSLGSLDLPDYGSVRLFGSSPAGDRIFIQFSSFIQPPTIYEYLLDSGEIREWHRKHIALPAQFRIERVMYPSFDGTPVPVSLVGLDLSKAAPRPVILTAYGAYGRSITPQFTAYGTFFVERGCIWAIANIRGGGEFGHSWHEAGRRRNRQNSIDDFLAAAEWLVREGFTTPQQLAIVGGSSAGLLVGAAVTQRPDLFRCALCLGPLLDMLRYHHCGNARAWREEFGSSDDQQDFTALRGFSPYHRVRDGVHYPAMMFISGHADDTCDPMHARKMTARMQQASASPSPIFLDYSTVRGHSPVMPLQVKIDSLTDRLAFLCDQLEVMP